MSPRKVSTVTQNGPQENSCGTTLTLNLVPQSLVEISSLDSVVGLRVVHLEYIQPFGVLSS